MDDDSDKGRKTNTERDHKPEGSSRNGYAPRGAEGRPAASGPSPGLGTSTTGRVNFKRSQNVDRSAASDQPEMKSQAQDSREYAIATGDEAVDTQAAQTDRVISREEAEKMIGRENVARHLNEKPPAPEPERPQISQSEFAQRFRAARDHTQSMQKSQENELE